LATIRGTDPAQLVGHVLDPQLVLHPGQHQLGIDGFGDEVRGARVKARHLE
jgi:hypothetical protein